MKHEKLLVKFDNGIPKSKEELNSIKKEFLLNDVKYKEILSSGNEPSINLADEKIHKEVVVGENHIIVKDKEFGFEEREKILEYYIKELDFHDEFQKALEKLFVNYCDRFTKELDLKAIYTPEMLEGFKKVKLKKINELKFFYNNESNITQPFKDFMIDFCDKVYEFISNFNNDDFMISDKLKFKLNRNQIILLFQTMLDKGVISGISQNDLYRILEEKTLYLNDKGGYEKMRNIRIQANKLQKGHTSSDPAIEKLSQLFDKNFFSSML